MRNSYNLNLLVILPLLFTFIYSCSRVDYYLKIKKDCNPKNAEETFLRLVDKSDPAIIKVIEAMADCRSPEMDRFLSEKYPLSDEKIKGYIYQSLVKNRSAYFANTLLEILINKIETNEDYTQILTDINLINPDIINKKYEELIGQLKVARENRNPLMIEIYLEKIRALSKVLKRRFNEDEVVAEIESIKRDREREELYSKFLDATYNQSMDRAYKIYSKLAEKDLIETNSFHKRLLSILKELADVENEFYKTAHRQDQLMIEIEKAKRDERIDDVKRLQTELNLIKSQMVLKKRALDRAAKRLEIVRELFSEVRKR